jgi:hypothetical protein
MLRRLWLPLVLLGAALLAGCGGSGGGSGSAGRADPAAAVPAGVPFYAEVVLRPSGGTRDDALAAAGKILHTSDPARAIRGLLQQAVAGDGTKVDFAKDIEPWLGDKAGAWFTMPARAGADPGGAAVVAVRDASLARSKIDELAKRNGQKLTPRSTGSHHYEVAGDGTAVAVAGDYAFVGTEGEVRRGLATLDGDGLAKSDAYVKAIEPLEPNRLAHFYLDLKSMLDAAFRADPSMSSRLGPFQGTLSTLLAGGPTVASFSADGDRLTLESVTRGGGMAGQLSALTGLAASPLLGKLPGDAWGAVAVPKVGASLRTLWGGFAGMLGGLAASEQLRREYGIDLEQDVFAWMGDAGLFVRGTSVDTVEGALVVEAADQARATTAFGKIVGLARTRGGLDPQPVRVPGADAAFSVRPPHAHKPLVLARGNGRVVAAYGLAAAASGVSTSSPLADSETMGLAKHALDGKVEPALLVAIAPVLALAESSGAGSDADYQKAKPYLEAFDVLAAGSKQDGDMLRSRVAVGLR